MSIGEVSSWAVPAHVRRSQGKGTTVSGDSKYGRLLVPLGSRGVRVILTCDQNRTRQRVDQKAGAPCPKSVQDGTRQGRPTNVGPAG
jgi:hypothetical protein